MHDIIWDSTAIHRHAQVGVLNNAPMDKLQALFPLCCDITFHNSPLLLLQLYRNKVSSIHEHNSNSVYTTQFMTSVYFSTVAKYSKTFIF